MDGSIVRLIKTTTLVIVNFGMAIPKLTAVVGGHLVFWLQVPTLEKYSSLELIFVYTMKPQKSNH